MLERCKTCYEWTEEMDDVPHCCMANDSRAWNYLNGYANDCKCYNSF